MPLPRAAARVARTRWVSEPFPDSAMSTGLPAAFMRTSAVLTGSWQSSPRRRSVTARAAMASVLPIREAIAVLRAMAESKGCSCDGVLTSMMSWKVPSRRRRASLWSASKAISYCSGDRCVLKLETSLAQPPTVQRHRARQHRKAAWRRRSDDWTTPSATIAGMTPLTTPRQRQDGPRHAPPGGA